MNDFISELEKNTSPYERNYRKYGEVLIKFRVIEPDQIRVQSLICFNPCNFVSFGKMLCSLADKYGITITGRATPTLVSAALTKNDKFFIGLDETRLIKLYKKFGFEIIESESGCQVKRRPNEVHS